MHICSIDGCNNEHEAKGFCRCHYRSYRKYGDPLFVDKKKSAQKPAKEKTKKSTQQSRQGTCEVEGCTDPIKAKRFCEKHYARQRRTGVLTTINIERGTITQCLALECQNPADTRGYCTYHYYNFRHYGHPHLVKIIRLCSIEGCSQPHLAKGLCHKHYYVWSKKLEQYNLSEEFK